MRRKGRRGSSGKLGGIEPPCQWVPSGEEQHYVLREFGVKHCAFGDEGRAFTGDTTVYGGWAAGDAVEGVVRSAVREDLIKAGAEGAEFEAEALGTCVTKELALVPADGLTNVFADHDLVA